MELATINLSRSHCDLHKHISKQDLFYESRDLTVEKIDPFCRQFLHKSARGGDEQVKKGDDRVLRKGIWTKH